MSTLLQQLKVKDFTEIVNNIAGLVVF